jgi:peptidoglycan hydrolase-like protein with peptidoglycan-binding domain
MRKYLPWVVAAAAAVALVLYFQKKAQAAPAADGGGDGGATPPIGSSPFALASSVSGYTPAQIKCVQTFLLKGGYYQGGSNADVDGVMGPRTTAAISNAQQAAGMPVTGAIDPTLLAAAGCIS